jgi:uncharacterized beta-barrel protein YwiB (DUF1934 family)
MRKCEICQSDDFIYNTIKTIDFRELNLGELGTGDMGVKLNEDGGKVSLDYDFNLNCTGDYAPTLSVPITYCPFCGRKLVQS